MDTAVEILDCTLRDGSYVIDFQFTAEDTALIASALESAGVRLIEVAHGLGLGAARAGKGDQAATDEAYLRTAASVLTEARFGAFFIPGIGTEDDLRMAADCGMGFVRVGTNITELDTAKPYLALAKSLGLMAWSNLMKSYAVPPETFGECARQAADYGADVVCLVDSAGGMLPGDVRAYIKAAQAVTGVPLGFHGHDNLCMAASNSLEAVAAGARYADATLQGMGRSAGNAVTEILAALLQKQGHVPDLDVNSLIDAGIAFVRPMLRQGGHSSFAITAGRAKFHSSFLGRALAAAAEYGVDPRDLMLRLADVDLVNPSDAVMRQEAAALAAGAPRRHPQAKVSAAAPGIHVPFEDQVRARAADLRAAARKLGLPGVLNIVVGTDEPESVSPFVETRYGCAISNVMLEDPARLAVAMGAADGVADYLLVDSGGAPLPYEAAARSVVLPYCDADLWARAAVAHVAGLLGAGVQGAAIVVMGVPRLSAPTAAGLNALGAQAQVLDGTPHGAGLPTAAAVIVLSPRRPVFTAAQAKQLAAGALLFDGGIGSLSPEAISAADARGLRVVRIDLRPSLAAAALERIGLARIVHERMGRATWNGVPVVAGGLIGRAGEVVVDSITGPTTVIGLADGCGGIRPSNGADPAVLAVRRAIAAMRLGTPEQPE